ncbi:hypothetical protein [Promicromonospora sp. NPDC090134]|uniref:hypothetical protein n=1 Tax=Promicromonospora sp. NPDC090134 TaxID=3364408 RepID=UPI0038066460
MKRLQVRGGCLEVRMTSVQPLTGGLDKGADRTPHSSVEGAGLGADPGQPELATDRTLIGQAMIERAKTVIVVAVRVDDDEAAQILLDAANQAAIPVRVAAGQVMTALQTGTEESERQETPVRDTLLRALGAVRPVSAPEDLDTPPARCSTDQVT